MRKIQILILLLICFSSCNQKLQKIDFEKPKFTSGKEAFQQKITNEFQKMDSVNISLDYHAYTTFFEAKQNLNLKFHLNYSQEIPDKKSVQKFIAKLAEEKIKNLNKYDHYLFSFIRNEKVIEYTVPIKKKQK